MPSDSKLKPKLGYAEYKCFPNDGRRHEIVDGDHYVTPAPNTYHQRLSRRIQFQLYTQIELAGLGEIFDAPTDLQLSDHDIVQPDLILVLRDRPNIITPTKIKGIPDLLVEILSESTADYDRVLKAGLYSRSKIPEYWIVDPDDRVVEQYVLEGEAYSLLGRRKERMEVHILPAVCVNLNEVW